MQLETITLGKLIEKLEQQSQENQITFDFCGLSPTDFDSWRGSYNFLALGWASRSESVKVRELLDRAIQADGKKFQGYKGGMYLMKKTTEVWVDNYGEYSCTGIVDIVTFDNYLTKIITQCFP